MGLRARILLPRALSEEEHFAIGYGLRKFCKRVEPGYFEEEGWDFWIENGKALRIHYRGTGRRLYISFYENDQEIDEAEARAVKACFGWMPRSAFTVGAYEVARVDHLLLGGLTLNLAEQFKGLVDYCGILTPGRTTDSQMEYTNRLRALKGKICIANSYYQHHISDTTFLHSWLQHPNFMMI